MTGRARQWIGFLVMLAGLTLLWGPFVLGAREERVQRQAVEAFYQAESRRETVPESTQIDQMEPDTPQNLFYQMAEAYNASLLAGGQDTMDTQEDVERLSLIHI